MRIRGSLGLIAFSVAASTSSEAWSAPTLPGSLTNPLASSSTCETCHSFPNADIHAGDPLYAPFFNWGGSMMANAARDPVFWAGVAIADQDEPGGTVDCIRCHSPRAFLEGRGDATSIDQLLPDDFEGVTCETCHRLQEDLGTPAGNAQYQIDDVLQGPNVPRRGPWTYPGPFVPPHTWIEDSYIGTSRACGTCHDVTTPRERVDDDGVAMGRPFNEQRTYSEWTNSDFAVDGPGFQSCQDCHMPAVADMPGCNDAVNSFSHPVGGRRHDLVGANRFMLQLLDQEYGDAGTMQVPSPLFNMSIDRTDELLATAASMQVEGPAEVVLGDGLDGLQVTVTNNSGHKLPSGYSEGRVMWIEVVASYAGTPVWTSGLWTQGTGMERDDQVRTYEGVAEEYATGTSLHLLLNDHWVEDTRIPPAGLVADIETDPVGDRYVLQGDGTWPNFDVAPYGFPAAPAVVDATPDDATDDVLDVQVRLMYVINTPAYLQFLADENTSNDAGNDVASLFEAAGGAEPVVLAEQTLQIPISGFGAVEGTTGTADDTAGTADAGGLTSTTSGSITTGPMTDTGTGETDDNGQDDSGGGCGCHAPSEPTAPAWMMFACFGLLATRRRRSVS
jgi:MYXO-CTERM domain-containing protein